MNLKEFNSQIERLKKVYGAARYPEERVELMYESLRGLLIEQFEAQVKRFIASTEKAPMLCDFENSFAGIMGDLKRKAIEEKLKNASDCDLCSNTGHHTMYEKETGFEFAFQCTCRRGDLLNPCFPKQYPGMGERYASHRAIVAGKFDLRGARKNKK